MIPLGNRELRTANGMMNEPGPNPASRLIVLEKGEIAEIGTHAELMEKKGVFHTLVETQSAINEIIGLGAA